MSNRVSLPYGTTIEVRDTCLCLHLQRAARAVARRFDELMRPAGLTSGQFSLLMSLNRPEPPTMRAVAELLAMDRTTLTANLKPLARLAGGSCRDRAGPRRPQDQPPAHRSPRSRVTALDDRLFAAYCGGLKLRPSKLFSGNQYFALPGVRGNGIASRTFDIPVT